MPETIEETLSRLRREQWQPIRDAHQSVHRGLGMELSDEDHAVVHDPSRPMHERATRLMRHLAQGHTREDYGWGGDTGSSGLGTHWTTDSNVAHHFSKIDASHRVKYDEDADPSHGHNADGFPRQRPETRVVLHAHFPEHGHIAHEEGDQDGAFGWDVRNQLQHTENGGGIPGGYEREVPIKRGQPVKVHAISWGLASHRADDEAPHDRETIRYDFPETQHHQAVRHEGRSWQQPGDRMTQMNPRELLEHIPASYHDHPVTRQLADSMREHGWDPERGREHVEEHFGNVHEDENPVTLWHTDRGSFVEPGNHRVPAAARAGLPSIPVLVKDQRTGRTASFHRWLPDGSDALAPRQAVTEHWPPYLTERHDPEYGDVPVNTSRHNVRGPVGTEEQAHAAGWVGPYFHGTSSRRAADIRRGGFRQPRVHNQDMRLPGDSEEVDFGHTHRTYFADTHDKAMSFARAHHGDDAAVVTAYLHPDHIETESGGGFMASTQVRDAAKAMAIRPGAKHAAFTPTQRIFGPTFGLDRRLFTGDRLRPDVRQYVLSMLGALWLPRYGPSWRSWARVYLAGSQASEWTSQSLVGNNDFDILIGIHYDATRECVPSLSQLSDLEMTDFFNRQFREELQPYTDPVWIPVRDAQGSSSWHPHSSTPRTSSRAGSTTTPPDAPPRRLLNDQARTSRRSADAWGSPESSETCAADAQDGRNGRSAGSATPHPSRHDTGPVGRARPTTSEIGTFGSTTGSQPSDSMRSSRSREAVAGSADALTSPSPWTTTTGAAQENAPAGSAYGASSAPGTTRPSPTSASPIWSPQSSGWTAESPPPAPEGYSYIGPFSNTFFVNADSWDIRDIKPYAAYEIVSDTWWVKPPHLPSWSVHDFPQGPGLIKECESYATIIKAILAEPEPYRSQRCDALWHYLHGDRSRAFGPDGEGWWDAGNVIEKWLDQAHLWEPLAAAHFATVADPNLLCAPARWSNDPRQM